ncbi:MAG: UUP1 family membrane protein, partial [Pseudomonadota bacterium]
MNSSAHTRILALLCLTIGLGIFVYKTSSFQTPLTAEVQETVWDIELFIDFMARDEPVRVEAFIPGTAGGRQIAQEQFYNGAFGHRVVEGAALTEDGEVAPQNRLNRKSIWTYRYPNDRKILRYQGRITAQDGETPIAPFGKKAQANLLARIADDVKRQAFLVWSSDLQRQSADADSFAALVVEQIFSEQPSDEVLTLLKDLPPSTARLVLARNVLISQKIPARIANGVVLTGPMRQAQVQHWLEYAPDGVGLRYFPGEALDRFFAIWFGEKPLIQADGAYELSAQISLSPVVVSGEIAAAMSGLATAPLVSWLRFDRLPLTTQLVYGVLVTIPVGITLLVFLRQFIGFQTLGTFMPVL